MTKKLPPLLAVAMMTAALALTVGGASPASAATSSSYGPSYIGSNSGGANLRGCPTLACAPNAYMPNGTLVTMQCWMTGETISPPNSDYTSNRWFRLNTPWGIGWAHSSLVENQTTVGHC